MQKTNAGNKKSWNELAGKKHRKITQFADLHFIEINVRRRDGLFTKYVWVFNNQKENITEEVGAFLKLKTSKSQKYKGGLINGGYGYHYTDYLIGHLHSVNYQSYEETIL
jgi:hypothetical protein